MVLPTYRASSGDLWMAMDRSMINHWAVPLAACAPISARTARPASLQAGPHQATGASERPGRWPATRTANVCRWFQNWNVTSAPFLPHTEQLNRFSRSDSRLSSGHSYASTVIECEQR